MEGIRMTPAIRKRDALERMFHTACVKSTMVCQLLKELEKHDRKAVARILKYADQHRERHRRERREAPT